MEKKNSAIDTIVYTIACILSLGTVWVLRVTISEAIRKATENKD